MIDAIAASQASQNPRVSAMSSATNSSNSAMQMEDFLQLLTSQISNQDPLEPMKDTEFISQMANIASLEQMQQFTKGFETFADTQKDLVAQAYLGKQVNISENEEDASGIVDAVEMSESGDVFVTVGGKNYLPSNITKVSISQ
jgi:flagellar basal-body rod modification protein FlgD